MFFRYGLITTILLSLSFAYVSPAIAKSAPAKAAKKKKAKIAKPVVLTLKIENLDKSTKPKQLKALRKSLKKVKGFAGMKAKPKKGELVLRHSPKAEVDELKAAIAAAGFTIAVPKEIEDEEEGEMLEE